MRTSRLIIYCSVSILSIMPVYAAGADPGTIGFESLFEQAVSGSPAARRIEAEAAKAAAEGTALKTLDNPELSMEIRPFVSGPSDLDDEYEIAISQPLTPSSFGARGRVARLIRERARLEEKLAFHELRQELLLLYAGAWSLQERQSSIARMGERIASLRRKVDAAREKGLLPASAALALGAKAEAIRAESRGVSAGKQRAFSALSLKSGVRLEGLMLERPDLASPSEAGPADLPGDLPAIERAGVARRLAAEQLRLARLDSYPRFVPRLGVEHVSDGADRVNIGLSFELPIFNRNQAERRRSEAEAALRDSESRFAEERIPVEAVALRRAAKESVEQIAMYRSKVLPAIEAALRAAEEEMAGGQANPQLVIQVLGELKEAEERHLELWVQALAHRVELAVLLGRDI